MEPNQTLTDILISANSAYDYIGIKRGGQHATCHVATSKELDYNLFFMLQRGKGNLNSALQLSKQSKEFLSCGWLMQKTKQYQTIGDFAEFTESRLYLFSSCYLLMKKWTEK